MDSSCYVANSSGNHKYGQNTLDNSISQHKARPRRDIDAYLGNVEDLILSVLAFVLDNTGLECNPAKFTCIITLVPQPSWHVDHAIAHENHDKDQSPAVAQCHDIRPQVACTLVVDEEDQSYKRERPHDKLVDDVVPDCASKPPHHCEFSRLCVSLKQRDQGPKEVFGPSKGGCQQSSR